MEPDTSTDEGDTDPQRRRKAIYLLPNLLTTAGMFAGFFAIVAATGGRFEAAAIGVLVAMLLDGVDGRIARMTNTQSEFGAQFDSLADLISFGLAPALVMYNWSLIHMSDLGGQWGKIGWLAAFFYAAMAAMRLARFNVQIGKVDKRYFIGLASPSAAMVMVSFIWVWHDLGFAGYDLWLPALLLTALAGALMVSPILYHSFKNVKRRDRIPFVYLLVAVLVIMAVTVDPPKVLFAIFFVYTLSGPALWLWRWRRKRQRHREDPDPSA